jgi:predicted nucleic acid-binding protein
LSLVLDASITIAWYVEGEATATADAVLDDVVASGAIVPPLWRLEVANALQRAVRRKRIDRAYRDNALVELGALPIDIDRDGEAHTWTATLALADTHDLSLYDATHLELAQRRRLPLATLDGALRNAATQLGIPVKG